MPDAPTGPARWILLGRILPRRTRERVFEPAFYDLLKRSLCSQKYDTVRFGGQAIGIFAGSFAVGILRFLTRRRLMTIGMMLSIISVIVAVLLRGWLVDLYQGTPQY